jgi:16S rRNA processing protein RimM
MTDAGAPRVVIGRVGKSHGLDGSFFVEQASEDGRWFTAGAKLVVGGMEAEVVAAKRGGGGRPVVRLDRRVPRGTSIEVDRDALPPTGEDEYYVFELVGLSVVEEGGAVLGIVADVAPGIANDVLTLDSGLALPMVEECVLRVDIASGRILVAAGFTEAPD